MRMLSTAFDDLVPQERKSYTYYPAQHAAEIDRLSSKMQAEINTGVYKCGFAEEQDAYDKAYDTLFASLDHFDNMLEKSGGPFLFGSVLTELDIRFYTTLVRFDTVYHNLFKTNQREIRTGFKHLNTYLKRLYSIEAFRSTTDFRHIKLSYFTGMPMNPTRITPRGPQPHIEPLSKQETVELDWKGTFEKAQGKL